METNRKRWSDEEVSRLRQIMTRYTKDADGCKYAAQELGRSYKSVYQKWYKVKPNKKTLSSQKEIAEILYNNVSKYPGNIQEAIRKTAEQTKKSKHYIANIYYIKSSPYHHSKASTCFTMISKNRMAANSKNFDSSKMPKTTKQRIKLWIANILDIKKEDL